MFLKAVNMIVSQTQSNFCFTGMVELNHRWSAEKKSANRLTFSLEVQ